MFQVVEVEVGESGAPPPLREAASRFRVELQERRSSLGEVHIGDVIVPTAGPDWAFEAALLRALTPKHVLFLCVANSARSQIGEGLGRAKAPPGVTISSAGSAPTSVRPQAIQVLAEVGIDATTHTSIGIDDVDGSVDAVITLCAEEVCPVWLEPAHRLHWGLPDPAGSSEDPDEELDAFRKVRDELDHRLRVLFEGGRV